MEAVPRLPMLSFELKVSPENVFFGPKLKQYVAEAYREDPESYSNDIHQLESLRSAAVRPTNDVSGCAALKRYFCQLRALETRFPMAKGQPAAIVFSWRDLYASMVCSVADVRIELASVLYNAAALHSNLGTAETRISADSMKSAVTHFQTAAWLLTYLREGYPQPPGVDLAPDVLRLLHEICLAQGQECILEKSLTDNKKPSIIGAVAMQVIVFYKNCLSLLGPASGQDTLYETMGAKLHALYCKYIIFKIAYHQCLVYLYSGMCAEEEQKMGERLAYYQAALDKLQEARKLSKGLFCAEAINEALSFTNDVVEGKRKAAANENEFIYHEEVPAKDLLVDPKPAPLVRDIAVDFNDPEVTGPLVFARLVPLGAHEASSIYSEEKAMLLRRVSSEAEKKNEELTEFLSSLQLEQLGILEKGVSKLPQAIVDRCAALAAKPTLLSDLSSAMNELAGLREDAHSTLATIHGMLDDEEEECRIAQRTPSLMMADLQREFAKYSDAHIKADESNQVLHKAMTLHLANLKLLGQPLEVIEEKIPSIDKLDINRSGLNEMKRIVNKASTMQKQRDSLLAELRAILSADDITTRILSSGTTLERHEQSALFTKELQKHTPKLNIIRQNLSAQDLIIRRLTELYAQQADNRRTLADTVRRRDALINSLITSYDTYEDLLGKARKGVDFYKKLSTNVGQLLARVRSVCQVNREEREQLQAAAQHEKPQTAHQKQYANESERSTPTPPGLPPRLAPSAPKLKDYLPYMRNRIPVQSQLPMDVTYLPAIRPAPLGSEGTNDSVSSQGMDSEYYKSNPTYPSSDVISGHYPIADNPYSLQSTYSQPVKYQAEDSNSLPSNMYQYAGSAPYDSNSCGYNLYNQEMPPQNTLPQTYPHVSTPSLYSEYNQNIVQTPDNPINYVNFNTNASVPQSPVPQNVDQQYYGEVPGATGGYQPPVSYIQNQMGQMQITDPQYSTASYPQYPHQPLSYPSTYQESFGSNYISNPQVPEANSVSSSSHYAEASENSVHSQYYPSASTEQTNLPVYSQNSSISNYSSVPEGFSPQPAVNTSYNISTQNPYLNNTSFSSQIGESYNTDQVISEQSQAVSNYSNAPRVEESPYVPANNFQYQTQVGANYDTAQSISNDQTVNSYGEFPASAQVHGSQGYMNQPNVETNPPNVPVRSVAEGPAYVGPRSYESHPGWHSTASGGYEYSSGYQQSNERRQRVDPGVRQAYSDSVIYSSAGSYVTSQSVSVDQTVVADQDATKYYSVQYGNGGSAETVAGADATQQNPTYVTSGNVSTTVTYTAKEESTSAAVLTENAATDKPEPANLAAEQSNVDLLAGLDFTVDQPTLNPEIRVPSVSESTIRKVLPSSKIASTSENKGPIVNAASVASIERPNRRDIFLDPGLVNKFTQEVKILQKFVDGLINKTNDGMTILDAKWKEIQRLQQEKCATKTTYVASSHKEEGELPTDVVPYDDTRVILKSNPHIYLNASYIRQLSSWCPPLILSAVPQEKNHQHFWSMVVQYQVAAIVCLLTEIELQGSYYWPTAIGQTMEFAGSIKVTLNECNCTVHWTERLLTVQCSGKIHQVTHYHINVFPVKVVCGPLILLVDNVLKTCGFHRTGGMSSVLLQCDGAREGVDSGGRSALIALVLMVVAQVRTGHANLCDMLQNGCVDLCEARKHVLEDTKTLMDAYRTALYYVQGVLCSGTSGFNGEMVLAPSAASISQVPSSAGALGQQQESNSKLKKFSKESFEDMKQTAGLKSGDMKDPLSFLDPLWSLKKK